MLIFLNDVMKTCEKWIKSGEAQAGKHIGSSAVVVLPHAYNQLLEQPAEVLPVEEQARVGRQVEVEVQVDGMILILHLGCYRGERGGISHPEKVLQLPPLSHVVVASALETAGFVVQFLLHCAVVFEAVPAQKDLQARLHPDVRLRLSLGP